MTAQFFIDLINDANDTNDTDTEGQLTSDVIKSAKKYTMRNIGGVICTSINLEVLVYALRNLGLS